MVPGFTSYPTTSCLFINLKLITKIQTEVPSKHKLISGSDQRFAKKYCAKMTACNFHVLHANQTKNAFEDKRHSTTYKLNHGYFFTIFRCFSKLLLQTLTLWKTQGSKTRWARAQCLETAVPSRATVHAIWSRNSKEGFPKRQGKSLPSKSKFKGRNGLINGSITFFWFF